MKRIGDILKLIGFILVAVGFLGLMLVEFVFEWGRIGTLLFATLDAAGLVILGFVNWGIKSR